jgi:hypothetical protein
MTDPIVSSSQLSECSQQTSCEEPLASEGPAMSLPQEEAQECRMSQSSGATQDVEHQTPASAALVGQYAESYYREMGTTPDGGGYEVMGLVRNSSEYGSYAVGELALRRGEQNNIKVALTQAKLELADGDASVTAELGTVQLGAGIHNEDGSTGFNMVAGAAIASVEGTVSSGASSLTLGASLGLGVGVSGGVRDADGDGAKELCAKLAVPGFPISVGLCIEDPVGWEQ